MSNSILKPRSAYEAAFRDRTSIASREVDSLFNELSLHKSEFDDHGYTLDRSDNVVSVRRGSLNIVKVIFNHEDTGRHQVVNGIADYLKRGLTIDFEDPSVARHEFKVQLRHATDLFYENKSQFEILGLL